MASNFKFKHSEILSLITQSKKEGLITDEERKIMKEFIVNKEPDLTDDVLNKHSSDLILAGHSHNGSIRTPWKSTIFKVVGANKYDNEYYKFENSELFISSGIGTNGSGIRLFCMPSISLYRLSRE